MFFAESRMNRNTSSITGVVCGVGVETIDDPLMQKIRYLGTLVGVVLIVLLNSVLSIMEMPEAGRQVIYGLVIILMLLVYGRSERVTS